MENLRERYERLLITQSSSIHEHMPRLGKLAREIYHIVELGVCQGHSTTAFLHSNVPFLTSVDMDLTLEATAMWHLYRTGCYGTATDWHFILGNDLSLSPIPCNLLFIDTWHAYPQLKSELQIFANSVDKYIVLHDTISFQWKGEGWQDWEAAGKGELKGLQPAIDEFLEEHREWEIREKYENNNGLTILGRKSQS